MKRILFVCTGNTCRSPMAEALFKRLLRERPELRNKVTVSSAGIYAYENDPASELAIDVMQDEFGIDLTNHRARLLGDDDVKQSWLILTMTRHHREMILDIYPEATDKVYTLKGYVELEDGSPDVSDPFGHDYEAYQACAYEIESLMPDMADKLFDNEEGFL